MTTPAERAFAEAEKQGLPRYITDPVALDKVAAVFLAAEIAAENARAGKARRATSRKPPRSAA